MSKDAWRQWRAHAVRQFGVGTLQQAVDVGMTRSAVRHRLALGDVERVGAHCLRLAGAAVDWRQEVMVGLLDIGARGAAGGLAAAALHGFDTCPEGVVELVVGAPGTTRSPRLGRMVRATTWLEAGDVMTMGPLRVLTPEATILDVAGRVSRRRLEHIVDSACRDRLTDLDSLTARLARWRRSGRQGVADLDHVLSAVGAAEAHSVLERLFFGLLADAGVPLPRGQVEIYDRQGLVGRVDALYEAERIVVELQSRRFHSDGEARRRDARRRARLQALGYEIIYLTYEDVRTQPAMVVRTVLEALGRRRF